VSPKQFAVYAGVLPEDKYKLVKAYQKAGHTVGMCGDGANDAPALRQAQMGIAVSTATDVAKSAAGMVLTEAGLAGIVAAVKEGRITFQRIQTYTLNAIIKKIVTVLFLVAGLIMTGRAILTPLLMVIVMLTGDFLSMSLTTDTVRPSPEPNAWRIGRLTMAGVIMGVCLLAFCTGVLAVGRFGMNLGIEALRTLAFVALVFGSQATIYAIRERRHLWGTRPSLLLAVSSLIDIAIASTLAASGIAMTRLPVLLVVGTLVAAAIFTCILDLVKVPVFAHLRGDQPTAAGANPQGVVASTPEKQAEPKPETKAATAADLAPSIAKRAYELYEQGGHQGGAAVQNWEKAEAEIREDLAKSESSRKPRPAANAPASG
jgi:H+-transporting ATPase